MRPNLPKPQRGGRKIYLLRRPPTDRLRFDILPGRFFTGEKAERMLYYIGMFSTDREMMK